MLANRPIVLFGLFQDQTLGGVYSGVSDIPGGSSVVRAHADPARDRRILYDSSAVGHALRNHRVGVRRRETRVATAAAGSAILPWQPRSNCALWRFAGLLTI